MELNFNTKHKIELQHIWSITAIPQSCVCLSFLSIHTLNEYLKQTLF